MENRSRASASRKYRGVPIIYFNVSRSLHSHKHITKSRLKRHHMYLYLILEFHLIKNLTGMPFRTLKIRCLFGFKKTCTAAKCMQMKSVKVSEKTTVYTFLGFVQKGNIELLQYRTSEDIMLLSELWSRFPACIVRCDTGSYQFASLAKSGWQNSDIDPILQKRLTPRNGGYTPFDITPWVNLMEYITGRLCSFQSHWTPVQSTLYTCGVFNWHGLDLYLSLDSKVFLYRRAPHCPDATFRRRNEAPGGEGSWRRPSHIVVRTWNQTEQSSQSRQTGNSLLFLMQRSRLSTFIRTRTAGGHF